eukprot:2207973-Prymnesium_polylepis.1
MRVNRRQSGVVSGIRGTPGHSGATRGHQGPSEVGALDLVHLGVGRVDAVVGLALIGLGHQVGDVRDREAPLGLLLRADVARRRAEAERGLSR